MLRLDCWGPPVSLHDGKHPPFQKSDCLASSTCRRTVLLKYKELATDLMHYRHQLIVSNMLQQYYAINLRPKHQQILGSFSQNWTRIQNPSISCKSNMPTAEVPLGSVVTCFRYGTEYNKFLHQIYCRLQQRKNF